MLASYFTRDVKHLDFLIKFQNSKLNRYLYKLYIYNKKIIYTENNTNALKSLRDFLLYFKLNIY